MNKKDEIIEAASDLFAEKGNELSMADIAQKVGIKTPSLYSHFESKEEIISIVIERETTRLCHYLIQTFDQLEHGSTERKLKKLYLSIFEYFNTKGRLEILRRLPLIDQSMIRETSLETFHLQKGILSYKLDKLIKEGVSNGELREDASDGVVLLYLTMVQGLLDAKLLYKYSSGDMEKYILAAWNAYWNGIKK